MSEQIDIDRALDLLRRVVEGREDYVYQRLTDGSGEDVCAYFDLTTGQPSCLVGHVLAEVGVTLDTLPDRHNVGSGIHHLDVPGVEMTRGARRVLSAAQRAQDRGTPWGEAAARAQVAAKEAGQA